LKNRLLGVGDIPPLSEVIRAAAAIIGFTCLIPPVRRKIAQYIIEKRLVQTTGKPAPNVIEGEFRKKDESLRK